MLEYGTTWADNNTDIKLSRIEYIPGNRPPVAQIHIGKNTGKDQLTIPLSADSSFDYDGDVLRYTWKDHKGNITGKDKSFSAVYDKPGRYGIRLEVADGHGNIAIKDSFVTAGVTTEVALQLPNRSFYWDTIQYALSVQNKKKDAAVAENAKVFLQYLPPGSSVWPTVPNADINGEVLMNESDCKGCHHHDLTSVGPSFMQIADRYSTQPGMIASLASKILKGGSGVWGNNNMSAHPQLSVEQATAIVKYIYSLNKKQSPIKELPLKGRVAVAPAGKTQAQNGWYKLKGTYTSDAPPFKGLAFSDSIILRSALVRAADFDRISDATISDGIITGRTFSFACLKDIDLSGIQKLKIWSSGPIEIRIDSEKGPVIGKALIPNSKSLRSVTTDLKPTLANHDIYFVFSVAEDGFALQQNLQQVLFIAADLSVY
jgi:cytochrome c